MVPQLSIYMHRLGPFHAMQMEALAKHTKRSYDLSIIHAAGTVHENMRRAFERSTSRYFIIMDDDCIVLDDGWLDVLLEDLHDYTDLGVLGVPAIQNMRTVRAYKHCRTDVVPENLPRLYQTRWFASYVMAFDRDRVPGVLPDVDIPHAHGMTDVDICLQVASAGFHCAMSVRTAVYHPFKGAIGKSQKEQHADQLTYMLHKWGKKFVDLSQCRGGLVWNYPGGSSLEEDPDDLKNRPDYLKA